MFKMALADVEISRQALNEVEQALSDQETPHGNVQIGGVTCKSQRDRIAAWGPKRLRPSGSCYGETEVNRLRDN